MMDEEKMFYNAVAIALDGNPSSMRMLQKKIKKRNGGALNSWREMYEQLPKSETKPTSPEKECKKLEKFGVRIIFLDDADYPPLLREIHHPPLALYIRGELPQAQPITIVGTRRATSEGKMTTKRFAHDLAQAGCAIVSGLALGIDAEAHKGCLEAGMAMENSAGGKTIAILARGLDQIYPAENQRLGREILEAGGAILSEYPIGEPPYPDRFLERNRIVSGLSMGVLVIEAPERSGSLATANFAVDQGRDVFVIPGPITHANFFGSHRLIRQGATLVTKPEDILEAYGLLGQNKIGRDAAAATDEEKQVLLALRDASAGLEVDKIIEITKLEPRVVNQTLSFLILKELIRETETGYIIE